MTDRSKRLTGRQFFKHLSESNRPYIIVDSDESIAFCNESAAALLSTNVERILGYRLDDSRPVADRLAAVEALLDSLTSVSSSLFALQCFETTREWSGFYVVSEHVGKDRFLRVLIGTRSTESETVASSTRERNTDGVSMFSYLAALRNDELSLKNLAAVYGSDPATKRALQQTRLAIESMVSVVITGPTNLTVRQVAEAVLRERSQRGGADATPTLIDCSLVDPMLLQELFDLAAERVALEPINKKRSSLIILHAVHLMPNECMAVLERALDTHSTNSWIATIVEEFDELPTHVSRVIERLGVLRIHLQPLSERIADIVPLARRMLAEVSGSRRLEISEVACRVLEVYPFPGDIEELKSAMQFASRTASDGKIQVKDLPLAIRTYSSTAVESNVPEPIDLDAALLDVERELIQRALKAFPTNRAAVAKHLGISRTRLLRKLEQLGIDAGAKTALLRSDLVPPSDSLATQASNETQDETQAAIQFDALEEDMPVFREITIDKDLPGD